MPELKGIKQHFGVIEIYYSLTVVTIYSIRVLFAKLTYMYNGHCIHVAYVLTRMCVYMHMRVHMYTNKSINLDKTLTPGRTA